jgi:hypothetical protein
MNVRFASRKLRTDNNWLALIYIAPAIWRRLFARHGYGFICYMREGWKKPDNYFRAGKPQENQDFLKRGEESSKHQRNSKRQASSRGANDLDACRLELLWSLGLGCWSFRYRAVATRAALDSGYAKQRRLHSAAFAQSRR